MQPEEVHDPRRDRELASFVFAPNSQPYEAGVW
jgi:hypothetical protein